MNLCTLL